MTRLPDTILIVDDSPSNLSVLFDILEQEGFKVLVMTSGKAALAATEHASPDLILLDVMMPGLNGFETCKRLKAKEATRHVPVLFMTALTDVTDEVQGFAVGAVDYIYKPIRVETVLARINTHLSLRKLQQQLEHQNTELNAFAHMVAHDLKNPLGDVMLLAQTILDDFDTLSETLHKEFLTGIYQRSEKAANIIQELLLLARIRQEDVPTETLDMNTLVQTAQERLRRMVDAYQGRIIVQADTWPLAKGYAPWVEEMWVNYLSNGLKYGGSEPHLTLGATAQANDQIQYWVQDQGPGIHPEDHKKLFKPFSRLDATDREGHGLGLSIVRRIAEKLGGRVGVESTLGEGSRFYFTLPVVD